MGKNAAHTAQKNARAGGGDDPAPGGDTEDGYDASFHTKAWHDARYALSDAPKETFEEYRVRKEKEDAVEQSKERELEDAEARYRQQMAHERKKRLNPDATDAKDAEKPKSKKHKSKKDKEHKKEKSKREKEKKHKHKERDRSP